MGQGSQKSELLLRCILGLLCTWSGWKVSPSKSGVQSYWHQLALRSYFGYVCSFSTPSCQAPREVHSGGTEDRAHLKVSDLTRKVRHKPNSCDTGWEARICKKVDLEPLLKEVFGCCQMRGLKLEGPCRRSLAREIV